MYGKNWKLTDKSEAEDDNANRDLAQSQNASLINLNTTDDCENIPEPRNLLCGNFEIDPATGASGTNVGWNTNVTKGNSSANQKHCDTFDLFVQSSESLPSTKNSGHALNGSMYMKERKGKNEMNQHESMDRICSPRSGAMNRHESMDGMGSPRNGALNGSQFNSELNVSPRENGAPNGIAVESSLFLYENDNARINYYDPYSVPELL